MPALRNSAAHVSRRSAPNCVLRGSVLSCRPAAQEYRLRLKRPAPRARRVSPRFNLNPRTVFRALAPAASFHGALSCRFVFGQKISQMIFFSSKANFQIFPKLLTKPRQGSPSSRNSRAMVASSPTPRTEADAVCFRPGLSALAYTITRCSP